MDERVLIKSKKYNLKKLFIIILLIGVLVSLAMLIWRYNYYASAFELDRQTYLEHQEAGNCSVIDILGFVTDGSCDTCQFVKEYGNAFSFFVSMMCMYPYIVIECCLPIVITLLVLAVLYLWLRSYELTITDKRIYGKVAWWKRVDLPVDSVSATATTILFKGVSVSTSSGKISFLLIKNAAEIYDVLSRLLIERQQEKTNPASIIEASKNNEVDQLKKYKELLDSGVITQEEFDTKKKQLLGL